MISKQAKMLERAIGAVNYKSKFTKTLFETFRGSRYNKPPKHFYKKYEINHFSIQDKDCYTMKSSKKSNKHIVFFHGGAYKYNAAKLHWGIINKILINVDCTITFIDYPLSTKSTCVEVIDMIAEAYKHLFKNSKEEIILMGDSAGGGLSLAMAQVIKKQGIKPKPKKLVLISPWLDVSMDYEISDKLDKGDKMLNKPLLTIDGKDYAGELDVKDYRCSPLFGDVKNIGEIAVFIGSSDMLITDAIRFKEKVDKSGGKLDYFEYENMQHDWMGFSIPEAKDAMKKMFDFINR